MKKNLIFAALIAAATIFSCAKDPVTNDNTDSTEPTEVTEEEGVYVYTLSASMETLSDEAAPQNPEEQNNEEQNQDEQNPEDGEVKATISDAGAFAWEAGDAIAVFATNGQKYTFTASSAAGASATFTTNATVSGLDFSGCKAYYPASIAGASAGSVTLPSAYESEDVARKAFPMEGTVSAEGTISFKHLGGLLKVKFYDIPTQATSLTISGTGLSGSHTISSGIISVGSSSDSFVFSFSKGAYYESEAAFYLPVPVGSVSLTFTFKDTNNNVLFSKGPANMTFTRKELKAKKALCAQGEEFYLISKSNGWSLSGNAARFFKIGANQYRVAAWTVTKNYGNNDERGYKVQPGYYHSNGGDWSTLYANTGGRDNYTGSLSFGASNNCGNGWDNADRIQIFTIDMSSLTFSTSDKCASNEYSFGRINFASSKDGWGVTASDLCFTKIVDHNWMIANYTVSSNSSVEFKIVKDADWDWCWGDGVSFTDATPYASIAGKNGGANNTYQLSAGTYNIYFNDVTGDTWFVKQ